MMDADFSDTTGHELLAKKPRPVGWFAAGLVSIAALTGVAAYYLPLHNAHAKLTSEHKLLAKKAGELDHSLKTDRRLLASTEGRREELQKFIDAGVEEEKRRTSAFGVVGATVERNLGPFIQAKLLEMEVGTTGVQLRFQEKALFRPRTNLASPSGMKTLCKATGALAVPSEWDVKVVTRARADDKKYWESAGERAALLADALETRCEISPDRIEVSVDRPQAEEGASLAAAEIAFSLHDAKGFAASDAPAPSQEAKNEPSGDDASSE